jgi:uncharacterized protein YceK
MKRFSILLVFLGFLTLTGCGTMLGQWTGNRNSDVVDYTDVQMKRSRGISTGIDPMAKEIENRLGYR